MKQGGSFLTFSQTTCNDIYKEIINFNSIKASEDTDIAKRIVRENANIMADLLSSSYNDAILNCNFPSCLKK